LVQIKQVSDLLDSHIYWTQEPHWLPKRICFPFLTTQHEVFIMQILVSLIWKLPVQERRIRDEKVDNSYWKWRWGPSLRTKMRRRP